MKALFLGVIATLMGQAAQANTLICRGVDKNGHRLTIRGDYETDGELAYWASGNLTVELGLYGETRTFGKGDWRMSADNASVGIQGETSNGSRISIRHYERFTGEDEIHIRLSPSDVGDAYSTFIKTGTCRL